MPPKENASAAFNSDTAFTNKGRSTVAANSMKEAALSSKMVQKSPVTVTSVDVRNAGAEPNFVGAHSSLATVLKVVPGLSGKKSNSDLVDESNSKSLATATAKSTTAAAAALASVTTAGAGVGGAALPTLSGPKKPATDEADFPAAAANPEEESLNIGSLLQTIKPLLGIEQQDSFLACLRTKGYKIKSDLSGDSNAQKYYFSKDKLEIRVKVPHEESEEMSLKITKKEGLFGAKKELRPDDKTYSAAFRDLEGVVEEFNSAKILSGAKQNPIFNEESYLSSRPSTTATVVLGSGLGPSAVTKASKDGHSQA